MKCQCVECGGSGRCQECHGNGVTQGRIDYIPIPTDHPKRADLVELKKDAKRVIAQCEELERLMPQYAKKYEDQKNAVLSVIDAQADKVESSPLLA